MSNDTADPQKSPTDITASAPAGTVPVRGGDSLTQKEPPKPETIQLPPRPRPGPVAPEVFHRKLAAYDGVLVALVLALAAFVSAFPVSNTTVMMHLATGRALVEGRYNPFAQQDPFAFTSGEARWVNHNWLYDLATYGAYRAAEGFGEGAGVPALIALKALLVVALALVLMAAGRAGPGRWGPALAVALALVAMSHRLLLDPMVVSFLFLGVTLWLLLRGGDWLYRPGREEAGRRRPAPGAPVTWVHYWPLLPLFAFWANLDEWFFLGPVTVALFALGQAVQAQRGRTRVTAETPRPGEVRALGVVLVAGLAACLLNPHHVFVFRVPAELGLTAVADMLKEDPSLRQFFYSPFNGVYFQPGSMNPSRLAYFPLAALGLLSFALTFRAPRWWRVAVFVPFLVLSAITMRAVPFFAVVAAPVLALNFHDFAVRSLSAATRTDLSWRRNLIAGRALTALGLVAVLACAWPGWLHAWPGRQPIEYDRWRVALADETDPSLRRTAEWIKEQRDAGRLPTDTHSFNLAPEVANALAWYCPEEKSFFDYRFELFDRVARDFIDIRHLLRGEPREGAPLDWEGVLARHQVDRLILYNPDPEKLRPALTGLWLLPRDREEKDWEMLYADGRSAVFGRSKVRREYRALALDPERRAFAPADEEKAPPGGMESLPVRWPFWEDFRRRTPPQALAADEARMHLMRFEVASGPAAARHQQAWQFALAADAVAGVRPLGVATLTPSLPSLMAAESFRTLVEKQRAGRLRDATPLEQFVVGGLRGNFLAARDDAPVAHLLLAVRAARRAVRENPHDAQAHLILGHAYFFLARFTRERVWSRALPYLAQLRHAQAAAAYNLALQLRPDLLEAHAQLAELYTQLGDFDQQGERHHGFRDVELHHLKAAYRLTRAQGASSDDPPERVEQVLKAMEERIKALEEEVSRRLDRYENRKHRFTKVNERAADAHDLNLAGKALQVLMESNVSAFGAAGMQMQVELALMTGRLREVNHWVNVDGDEDEFRSSLGEPTFSWVRARIAVCKGAYGEADDYLGDVAAVFDQRLNVKAILERFVGKVVRFEAQPPPVALRQTIAMCLAQLMLEHRSLGLLPLGGAPRAGAKQGEVHPVPTPVRIQELEMIIENLYRAHALMSDLADFLVLRGMVALEAGEVGRAEEAFGKALLVWRPKPGDDSVVGQDFLTRSIAEEWLQVLARHKKRK